MTNSLMDQLTFELTSSWLSRTKLNQIKRNALIEPKNSETKQSKAKQKNMKIIKLDIKIKYKKASELKMIGLQMEQMIFLKNVKLKSLKMY